MAQLVSDGDTRRCLGDRQDQQGRRPAEPEPRLLRPRQPALRDLSRGNVVRARRPDPGPAADRAGLERREVLLGGRRRGWHFPPFRDARLSEGARRGHLAAVGPPAPNAGGDCREVPDVSADADRAPATSSTTASTASIGMPWAARAVPHPCGPPCLPSASTNGTTAGYGQAEPGALSPGAADTRHLPQRRHPQGTSTTTPRQAGQYPAMAGYDMATGLGTPVAPPLATGLSSMPLNVTDHGHAELRRGPDLHGVGHFRGTRYSRHSA